MPITTHDNRRTYVGDGVTRDYDTPPITAGSDLAVAVNSVPQALGTDYTVSQLNEEDGGRLSFQAPPAAGAGIVILRRTAPTQPMRLRDGDPAPAQAINRAHDRRAMVEQYLWERASRSLALDDLDTAGDQGFQAGGKAVTGLAPGTEPDHAATVGQMTGTLDAANRAVADANDAMAQVQAGLAAMPDFASAAEAIDGVPDRMLAPREAQSMVKDAKLFTHAGTGAVPRTIADKLREIVSVVDFGAQPDGDDDSGPAFNLAIEQAANYGRSIYVPRGIYNIVTPIVSGTAPLYVTGEGAKASRLVCGMPSMEMWIHNGSASDASLSIEGIGFYATGAHVLRALNVNMNSNAADFRLSNVIFSSFSSTYGFENFVLARGATNTVWRNVSGTGPWFEFDQNNRENGPKIAFDFVSFNNTNKSCVYLFENTETYSEVTGFNFSIEDAPGNSGSFQGISMTNCFGRTLTGPWVKINTSNNNEQTNIPYLVLNKCSYQGPGAVLDAQSVSSLFINECLYFTGAPVEGSSPQNFIEIGRGSNVRITNNIFNILPNTNILDFIRIGENSEDVQVTGNAFIGYPDTNYTSGVFCHHTVTPKYIPSQTYIRWNPATPREWDGSNRLNCTISSNGNLDLSSAEKTIIQLHNPATTEASSYLRIEPGATGSGPTIYAEGAPENVPITFIPKGQSPLQFMAGFTLWNQFIGTSVSSGTSTPLPPAPHGFLVWSINGENMGIPIYKYT